MTAALESAESRITKANQRAQAAAERQQEMMQVLEKQREQMQKKSSHIDHLTSLLEEANQQLKASRGQAQQ